jgi:hypothetical protein
MDFMPTPLPISIKLNEKYLITTSNWFIAPDGNDYRSVHGTVKGILDSETVLGIKTNRGSSNWFISIGNMFVAGCQIHYCVRADHVNHANHVRSIEYNGELIHRQENCSKIYDADECNLRAAWHMCTK